MILQEFAIDPDVVQDWTDLNIIEMTFGFHNGAIIPMFPKRWLAGLRDRAKRDFDGSEKYLYIVEKLNCIRDFYLVKSGRAYNADIPWLNNAINQRDIDPFYRIVTRCPEERAADIIDFAELDESCFNGLREGEIQRTKEALAETCALLLRRSKSIKFIDPYFSNKPGYLDCLEAMLLAAGMGARNNFCGIEVHASSVVNGTDIDINEQIEGLEKFLPRKLVRGFEVDFFWWDDPDTKEIHPRYLLTDLGGIRVDRGFVQPPDHGQRAGMTDVSMMTRLKVDKEWNRYRKEASPFQLVRSHRVTGN